MTDCGLLIVLSGPSGVGKDAVLKHFLPSAKDCARSVSATTRKIRQKEEHGRDYFFLSREEFTKMAEDGELLEYTEYNGNFYGTPRKNVEETLKTGKNVILKIETEGAAQIKKMFPRAVMIFLAPPSWQALEQRLRSRGTESEDALRARLALAKHELSKAREYDYIIINDFIELCVEKLSAVIKSAGFATVYMEKFIREVCEDA